jgi:branched-chain amino acid transport system substrate-binding protein
MKNIWIGIIIIAAVVLALVLIVIQTNKGPNEIKIGAILPLTGDNAVYGVAIRNGIELGIEEINKNGSLNGKKIRVIFEDDRADPSQTVSAYTKLTHLDKVSLIIGGVFSASSLAIAPLSNRDKIILLSPTSSAVELTNAGPWFFRIYPSDSYDGLFLAKYAIENLKAQSVAVLYLQVNSTTAIAEVFKDKFIALGGKIVLFEGHAEGTTDFRSALSRLKNIKADIVFLPSYLKEMAILLKQGKELGINTQFLSISTFNDPRLLELAGNAAEKVLFSTPYYDPASPDKLSKSFVNTFRTKYNETPNIWAGYGYDVIRVAERAYNDAGNSSTPETIRDALSLISGFPGVTGTVTFDKNGDVEKELSILQVKDGKFVPYQK